MQDAQVLALPQAPCRTPQLARDGVAAQVLDFAQARRAHGVSQRVFAHQTGVARSTLQGRLARRALGPDDPDLAALDAFFATPAGVRLLARLLVTLILVFCLVSTSGVRHLALFLQLSGFARWIAPSLGYLAKQVQRVEQETGNFGTAQRELLCVRMPPRAIAACADETFHPRICLVAIEPVSNFILLEKYALTRDGLTWATALRESTRGMPVWINQLVGDQAKGLRNAALEHLGAHAGADLFHPQYELSKGTARELARRVDEATEARDAAQRDLEEYEREVAVARAEPRSPGRPINWDARTRPVRDKLDAARVAFDTAVARRNGAQEAIRGLSAEFHPFDTTTGAVRSAETVKEGLTALFAKLYGIAHDAGLPVRSLRALARAEGTVAVMVATIVWVHVRIEARLAEAMLHPAAREEVVRPLIAVLYLRRVARCLPTRELREAQRAHADALLAHVQRPGGCWSELRAEVRRQLWKLAQECADLFQRSSSCVEGRNGQLSLFHHRWHQLSDRKLAALTVVHNYVVTRADGTTAAERFFGQRHEPLLDWLLRTVPAPSRPRQQRPRQDPEDIAA